ncbi:MAG: PepSY domain-containing protein [Pseudomonadota bacterium]|nr:PepSY domain-containing protein [Pseudomonadota bacterium]
MNGSLPPIVKARDRKGSMWGRFARQPQSVWVRRALFEVHLWVGIGIGLYVVLICLSGSAIVFRIELDKLFCPRTVVVSIGGRRMTDGELAAAARAAYPQFNFSEVEVRAARAPNLAVEVAMTAGPRKIERLFDPYSGRNLADTVAGEPAFVTWLVDFHDDLKAERTGRRVNGIGAVLMTLLCATGAVIWWPGRARWRQSLSIRPRSNWRRFNWDLHSMLGFWTAALILVWTVTGIYFAFPAPFDALADLFRVGGDDTVASSAIDAAVAWLVRLHFGRTFGPVVKWLWVFLGLVPAVLFVTGALMWWNRTLRRRWPALRLRFQRMS